MRIAFRLLTCILLTVAIAACDNGVREEVSACDRTGNSNAALQLCTDALGLADLADDERIAVLFSRGSIHANRSDWNSARADVLAIRDIDPASPLVPRGLAYIELRAGNPQDGLRLYEEAVLLDPEDATLIGLRGYARYRLQQYEEAVQDLTLALDPPSSMHVDDANIDVFRQVRGISLVEMQRYAAAMDDLGYWVGKNPSEPWGLAYRGIALAEQSRVREAIADFDAAVANGGTAAWLRELLSRRHATSFYGPETAPYETGVRYALETLARLAEEYPGLEAQTLSRRREALFPNRLFSNAEFLFALETGLAPLRLGQSQPLDRARSSYYYAVLVNRLNGFGDPACGAVVKSLDQLSAGLAATNDVLSMMQQMSNSLNGAEFLVGLAVLMIGAAVIEETAIDDAAMLAARHGCASPVVVNIIENGSKYLAWSMSL